MPCPWQGALLILAGARLSLLLRSGHSFARKLLLYVAISVVLCFNGIWAHFRPLREMIMATNNIGVGSNQTANGLSGNDSIFGTGSPSLNDIIYGHMGNDTINGLAGSTEIDLSTMYGGQGNDLIFSNQFDTVYGNLGNDTLSSGAGSSSTLYGGQGDDLFYSNGTGFAGGTAGSSNVYYGNLGNDGFDIAAAKSTLFGGQGSDSIGAYGIGDLVHGNLGDDFIAGIGNSTLYGDGGNDVIFDNSSVVSGDVSYGNLGNDFLYAYNNATMYGGQGDDLVTAGDRKFTTGVVPRLTT